MADERVWLRRVLRYLLSLPVLIAAIALTLYALAGFFLAPYLVKREIPHFASERLQAKAAIAEVRINPFLLTAELRGFQLREQDDRPVLGFDRLFVDLAAASLFRWAWSVEKLLLEAPRIDLDIDPKGELNLLRLANRLAPPDPKAAPKDEPLPRLLLNQLAVARARVTLTDRSDPTPAQVQIDPVTFELKDLSTLPGHRGDYTISARLPAGGTLAWRGKVTLQPIAAEGEIALKDLKFATVWRFLQDELRVEEPAGSVDLALRYSARHEGNAIQLTAANVGVRAAGLEVKLRGAKAPLVTLAEASLSGGTFDFAQRKLAFAQLMLRRGAVNAARDETGALDWQAMLAPAGSQSKAAPTAAEAKPDARPWRLALDAVRLEEIALRVTDATRVQPLEIEIGRTDVGFGLAAEHGPQTNATIDGLSVQLAKLRVAQQGASAPLVTLDAVEIGGGQFDLARRNASVKTISVAGGDTQWIRDRNSVLNLVQAFSPKRPEPPEDVAFTATVDTLELSKHRISITEQMVEPPIRLDLEEVSVKLADIVSDGGKPLRFEVATRVKQGGNIKAAGTFHLAPLRAAGRLAVSRLAALPFEPLIAGHVNLKLASGSASLDGRFRWELDRQFGQRLAFRGGGSVDDLLFNDAAGERFFACQSIAATGVDLDLRKPALAVEEARIVAPVGKIVINKDRSTNLAAIMRAPAQAAAPAAEKPAPLEKPAAPEKPTAAPEKPFPVTVERVRIEKGDLDFADLSLVLPFGTRIREVNGMITGLSSDPGARASVKLEGQVEDYGLARAEGTINPFAPKTHTDLAVQFRNVMLPSFSPYSATFAGRRIASGRLSLDLQYKINNSELQGENKVVLEQFTLGERVESPGALNLPLDLAVALLTDSNGKIDLAVPVRGNVDHPEFSYGHVIWQAIRNLLTRIVTAPFRALASLFGGSGEALDEIAFDPGSARLLPPEREKLVRLADTLKQRPQVKLVVQGRYHAERDGAALRDVAARRALAERLGGKPAPGEDPGPVAYDNARTQRMLETLLAERAGAEAPAQFAAAFQKEKGREAQRVNPALALVGRGSADREFYEAVFRRVAELQQLPPGALEEIARARGTVIAKQVGDGIGAARVDQQKPEAVSGAQVTCKLTLDVAKAAP